jgi:hypothetical protein
MTYSLKYFKWVYSLVITTNIENVIINFHVKARFILDTKKDPFLCELLFLEDLENTKEDKTITDTVAGLAFTLRMNRLTQRSLALINFSHTPSINECCLSAKQCLPPFITALKSYPNIQLVIGKIQIPPDYQHILNIGISPPKAVSGGGECWN